jgi:pre-rRNA-processing protein IPI3
MLKHEFFTFNANLLNVAGPITNILVLSPENDSSNHMSSNLQAASKKKVAQFPPLEKYANPIDEDSDIKTIVSLGGSKRCMDDVSYLSSHVISSYSKELQVSI